MVVARAYIQGLERDRILLLSTQEKITETVWEVIQLGGYNRALYQLMHQIIQAYDAGSLTPDLVSAAEDLLAANRPLFEKLWSCPCGHSVYDHDEKGCMYLGCRAICGVEEDK